MAFMMVVDGHVLASFVLSTCASGMALALGEAGLRVGLVWFGLAVAAAASFGATLLPVPTSVPCQYWRAASVAARAEDRSCPPAP